LSKRVSRIENIALWPDIVKMKIQIVAGFLFFACLFQAQAEVRLPAVFANHMVIQRQAPVHVWGFAAAGESVQVAFRDAIRSAVANRLGRWEVFLPAGEAGGPFTMEIAAANHISISDILVGDVWFASGQSNMEFPTAKAMNAEKELQNADHPDIRLFQINKGSESFPQLDVHARGWKPANRESVAEITAVGYFFARELNAEQKAPIGIIESDWGGTPAEAWTSLPALTADASLLPVLAAYAKIEEAEGTNLLEQSRNHRGSGSRQARADVSLAPGASFLDAFRPL
jgi:sialate O-acetylesterase